MKKIASEVKQSQKATISTPTITPIAEPHKEAPTKPQSNITPPTSTPIKQTLAEVNKDISIAQATPILNSTTTAIPIAISDNDDAKMERSTAPNTVIEADSIYTIAHQMPEFPGGQKAAYDYLSKNLIYPTKATENNIEGTVYVRFLVTPKGEIKQPFIERGMGAKDYGCHEEALRLVKNMPNWEPGVHNGKKVNVRYTLAVSFKKAKK